VLLRRVARPLIAAVSIANGVETLINPKPKIEATTPLLAKTQEIVPTPPVSPAVLVQASAAMKITAGLMMALGWAPQIAAAVLAADLIPSTVAEHPFWAPGPPDVRRAHQQHFLANCGLLGGLLLAISTPRGKRRRRR
jgi:uncharacterized membrane protein YphA (DoxX/SURF4 family)